MATGLSPPLASQSHPSEFAMAALSQMLSPGDDVLTAGPAGGLGLF